MLSKKLHYQYVTDVSYQSKRSYKSYFNNLLTSLSKPLGISVLHLFYLFQAYDYRSI